MNSRIFVALLFFVSTPLLGRVSEHQADPYIQGRFSGCDEEALTTAIYDHPNFEKCLLPVRQVAHDCLKTSKECDRLFVDALKPCENTILEIAKNLNCKDDTGTFTPVPKDNECEWEEEQAVSGGLGALLESYGPSNNKRAGSARLLEISHKGACEAKTKGLPAQLCYGKAVCGKDKTPQTLLCELSAQGTCPTATQCQSPSTTQANPHRLAYRAFTDEDKKKLPANLPADLKNAGSPPAKVMVTVPQGGRMEIKGTTKSACVMDVQMGGTATRTYLCLGENVDHLLACEADPCVMDSTQIPKEGAYNNAATTKKDH